MKCHAYCLPRCPAPACLCPPPAACHAPSLGRLEEPGPHGEDQFEAAASTRVDMRAGGIDAPYVHHKGDFHLRFSLVYASLEDVLPPLEELLLLAHAAAAAGGTRAARAEAAQRLAKIIQVGAGRCELGLGAHRAVA